MYLDCVFLKLLIIFPPMFHIKTITVHVRAPSCPIIVQKKMTHIDINREVLKRETTNGKFDEILFT